MFTLYLAAPTPYAPPYDLLYPAHRDLKAATILPCTQSLYALPCILCASRRPSPNPNPNPNPTPTPYPNPNPNKAANIFMFDDGYLKLGDFGVSKVFKTLAWLSS